MKSKLTLLALLVILFAGCGPTISGKDEESFQASKAKLEEKLEKQEKETLEKALRIVMLKAMKEKFIHPDDAQYKGKSFNTIAMAMIDGKTFSGIVDFAEDFLQKDRADNIKRNEAEIDSLTKEKAKLAAQNKLMDNFKMTKIRIIEEEHFDEKRPYVEYTFVNNTGAEILGYMIGQEVFSKKTGERLASLQAGNRSEIDSSVKDGDGLKPGEEISMTEGLNGIELKNVTYPITDFSKLEIEIKVSPVLIITRKGKLVRTQGLESMDKKIKYLQKEIIQLKETKGTLEELELTR
ncbi:DUF6694 family lipoprotein [Pedobacter aquatilis]|uniref:DUF6694 family lipoprotein n=1 Tax=Pedobacter aquatilis TaxID=351343 RepID=UPI0029310645|nr:DUF6694 family lipoprotein [Pedobacter aquatilis]